MLMLPAGLKIWVAAAPVSMRKSFDGLAALVQEVLRQDALSGHLFVFRNRAGDKVKVLYWDRSGLALWYKRLERGVFRFPRITGEVFQLSASELSLLLEGIDLTDKRRFGHISASVVS